MPSSKDKTAAMGSSASKPLASAKPATTIKLKNKKTTSSSSQPEPFDPEALTMAMPTVKTLTREETAISATIDSTAGTPPPEDLPRPTSSGSMSSLASARTIPSSGSESVTRPEVHFFCYEGHHPHGPDKMTGKDENEVIIIGFNTLKMAEIYLTDQHMRLSNYKVPRLHLASQEPLTEDEEDTARTVSGYIHQIQDRIDSGDASGISAREPDLPNETLGFVNMGSSKQYFVIGANDLVVLEPLQDNPWDKDVPWKFTHYFPFSHEGHFERTGLRHWAWEWLKWTDRIMHLPPEAIDGVHIWFIDYKLKRRAKYREQTTAEGFRHVFYGHGARFVEVKMEDREWHGGRGPYTALQQVANWDERREREILWDNQKDHYNWPKVGVLALELGDF